MSRIIRYMIETGLVLTMFTGSVEACSPQVSPGESWEPWSIEKRLYQADIVVHGRVLEHVNDITSFVTQPSYYQEYDAKFQVYCVYKGDYTIISVNITITDICKGAYCSASCFMSNTEVGKEYVVMLSSDLDGKYPLQELHSQEAVFPANEDNLQILTTVYGLQSPNPPLDRPDRYDDNTLPSCIYNATVPPQTAYPTNYGQPTSIIPTQGWKTGGSESVVSSLFGVLLVSLTAELLHC